MPRAKQIRQLDGQLWGIQFECPACNAPHRVPTKNGVNGTRGWGWNGNLDLPTLTPSVLLSWNLPGRPDPTPNGYRCHSTVTDGRIHFHEDCRHALANQTVDLPELGG